MNFSDKLKVLANDIIETAGTLGTKAIEEIKKIDLVEVFDSLKERTDEYKKKIEKLEKLSDKELFNLIKENNSNSSLGEKVLLSRGYTQEQIKFIILKGTFQGASDLEKFKQEIEKMKNKT